MVKLSVDASLDGFCNSPWYLAYSLANHRSPPSVSPEQSRATTDSAEPRPISTSRLPTPTPSTVSIPASGTPIAATLSDVASTSELAVGYPDAGTGDGGESPAAQPPLTPSPPPPIAGDSKALYDLMLTIPPKTLHAYTLAHLRALSLSPSSSTLYNSPGTRPPISPPCIIFFATLAPPPLLHCVRCHAEFYAIENEEKDKAALVSRVTGGGYETLWGCCGKTVEGNGGEGPPDGWCYEGRHTTDTKRARFRADSTIHDDKLTSCLKLNCRGIRDTLPRPSEHLLAQSSRHAIASVTRKRPRKSINKDLSSASEDEQEHASHRGEPECFHDNIPASTSLQTYFDINTHLRVRRNQSRRRETLLSQSQKQDASDSDTSSRVRPRTRSLVRKQSKVDSTRLRRSARESSRSSPLRKATQGSEGDGDGGGSTDNRGDDREEGTRGRKKRRTGA
ncbi:hypothetical protein BKA82DRAFT_4111883 [Pisolithus tinctorius]|nr:hypothetical protein BKA82DRAFT_4111883 [Pisolithus tinctorius]